MLAYPCHLITNNSASNISREMRRLQKNLSLRNTLGTGNGLHSSGSANDCDTGVARTVKDFDIVFVHLVYFHLHTVYHVYFHEMLPALLFVTSWHGYANMWNLKIGHEDYMYWLYNKCNQNRSGLEYGTVVSYINGMWPSYYCTILSRDCCCVQDLPTRLATLRFSHLHTITLFPWLVVQSIASVPWAFPLRPLSIVTEVCCSGYQ